MLESKQPAELFRSFCESILLDASGTFEATGTHVFEHGGPIREDEEPDEHPALYQGSVRGSVMTLSVTITDMKVMTGRFILEQEKTAVSLDQQPEKEWQLFLGNKDIYGFSFKFLDLNDIAEVSYPVDVVSIERMEYGDAIGFLVSLELEEKGYSWLDKTA